MSIPLMLIFATVPERTLPNSSESPASKTLTCWESSATEEIKVGLDACSYDAC